jgi:hypothetical protein
VRYKRDERLRVNGRDPGAELDEEIGAHIEMRAEALMAQGLSPEDAYQEAARRFGDLERARARLVRLAHRQERRLRWGGFIEGVGMDLRLALRGARRSRSFAVFSVLILASAIGLAGLTFTVTDHVLLRPLPYPDSEQLVALQSVGEAGPFNSVSMPNWVDWKEKSGTLAYTAFIESCRPYLTASGV